MASSSTESFTNNEIKDRIRNIWSKFVSGVEPARLSDWLVQENVITSGEWQSIHSHHLTREDRCRALLHHLFSIPHPRAFLVVYQALAEQGHYLLESINNQEPGSRTSFQPELQGYSDSLQFRWDPVLVQTIRPKAAEKENKWIIGLTILDKELFVVSDKSSEVEVYDSIRFSFRRRWILNELINPVDIGSCNRNKCLYIINSQGQTMAILRVDPNGKLIMKWSTERDYGGSLSVTKESNIIVTVSERHKIKEFSPDGKLIREVNLDGSGADLFNPFHAIKLTNGHFVVSHGYNDQDPHRVCVVDAVGKLQKSFGRICGSAIDQMNCPVYLAVYGNGFVMVVDQKNSRVLLLDSDLKLQTEVRHELRNPRRILLDESNGRLFVADNESNNQRILIFNYK